MSRLAPSMLQSIANAAVAGSSSTTGATSRVAARAFRSPVRSGSRSASSYSSTSSSGYSSRQESFRDQLRRPTTLVLICVPIVTFGLGWWQIQRLRWKVGLIEEVERNMQREPMVLPPSINLGALPDFAFRRVLLKGKILSPPILLGPRVEEGVPGWDLVQPLSRAPPASALTPASIFSSSSSSPVPPGSPSTILLNRGFISNPQAQAIRAGHEPPPNLGEEIVVEGYLSKLQGQGWSPENRPEQGEWFWKDVERMADWAGGEERGVQPVLVDVIDQGDMQASLAMQRGIPLGKPPVIELRNQHAQYAATWFSLSAATSVMLVLLFRRGRGGPKARQLR